MNIMMLKVNNTDDFQITMELNVDYGTPEITVKINFWNKKAHSIQGFEYSAEDFGMAIKKFNELEMDAKNKKESPKTMKFVDFINEHLIKNQEEYDAVIGDVDMPATLGMCENWVITDYCKEKFGKLLDSKCKIINDTTVEVIDDIDYRIGRNFCYSVAGYINCEEFDKLFGTHDAEIKGKEENTQMKNNIREIELFFNRYDEDDFCFETVHFIVERIWLEDELAHQTIEDFKMNANSDEVSDIYTYALLYDRVLKEWTVKN